MFYFLWVLQILKTQRWLSLRCLPVSTAAAILGYTWSSAVTSCRISCTACPAACKWKVTSERRIQTAASAEQPCCPRWPVGVQQPALAFGENWTFLQSPPTSWRKVETRPGSGSAIWGGEKNGEKKLEMLSRYILFEQGCQTQIPSWPKFKTVAKSRANIDYYRKKNLPLLLWSEFSLQLARNKWVQFCHQLM